MPIPVVAPIVERLDKPSACRDGHKEKERDERPKAERPSGRSAGNSDVFENRVALHQE